MCENTSLGIKPLLAWENSRHLATLPLLSPPNDVWEKSAEIPYWWRVTTQIGEVLLIGRATWEIWFNQSEALPRSGWWRVISMAFLHSFLTHHLVGKPVVALPNAGCFLRLTLYHPHSSSVLHVLTFQFSLCLRPILLLLCEQLPVIMKTKQKYNKYI